MLYVPEHESDEFAKLRGLRRREGDPVGGLFDGCEEVLEDGDQEGILLDDACWSV